MFDGGISVKMSRGFMNKHIVGTSCELLLYRLMSHFLMFFERFSITMVQIHWRNEVLYHQHIYVVRCYSSCISLMLFIKTTLNHSTSRCVLYMYTFTWPQEVHPDHGTLRCSSVQQLTVITCENPLSGEKDPGTSHNLMLYRGQSVIPRDRRQDHEETFQNDNMGLGKNESTDLSMCFVIRCLYPTEEGYLSKAYPLSS